MDITALSISGYEALKEKYGMSDLTAKVCCAKALNEEQIQQLLTDEDLANPFDALGMQEVIARIKQAKQNKEKVLVCGDYDADGICATTILYDALCRYGITCGFYIPNRFREGYGLHSETVELAHAKGYRLLITVDNGVKALPALKRCKELDIDCIVSDHHAIEDEVPCTCLLHCHRMGPAFAHLCGAGIAFFISYALLGEIKEHAALAAIASIGDVMPLWKETRKLVKKGIAYLREGVCLPIQQLGKDITKWDERSIAFQIVPKLNATGRLADLANANNTVRYLLMKDRTDIIVFARQIEDLNQKRRAMSAKMSEFAHTLVCEEDAFLMVHHEQLHEGLLGIVAAKLCEEYQRPAMVFVENEDEWKGSIRSHGDVDLRTFFHDCPISFISYGGHAAAAGITIHKDDYEVFHDYVQKKMQQIDSDKTTPIEVIPALFKDCQLSFVDELESLAPFGEGFSKPLFWIADYPVRQIKELSNGKHVKWESLENVDALYFHAKDVYAKYQNEKQLSFLGTLSVNEFRNERKVNIIVEAIVDPQ